MKSKKPNFFLVGAPKTGTTAIAKYLGDHPSVFFSDPKEPNFFNTDFSEKYRPIRNWNKYLNYCFYRSEGYKAVGEGTVWYLYSKKAIPAILDFNPQAKFIVGIRNPIEMAPAMHATEVMVSHESEKSFARAWELQFERKQGKAIPKKCPEPKVLMYGDICSMGAQLNRMLARVKPEQVYIYLFDDLKQNPKRVYKGILEFLGLRDDGRDDFPVLNPYKRVKSPVIADAINSLSRKIDVGPLKKKMGIKTGGGFFRAIKRMNTKKVKKRPLSPALKKELWEYFRKDVAILENLLDRDLTHWNPNRQK